MNVEQFKRIQSIADSEIKFQESNVLEVSARVPALYQKYLDIYLIELKILKDQKTDIEKDYGELLFKLKHKSPHAWTNKGEIESQIKADPGYHQKRVEMNKQEYMVEYLEGVLDNVKRLSFSIKNFIDMKKFNAGMF